MHASSYENMAHCYERFIRGPFLASRPAITVLDLGAADVNGSYRPIFLDEKITYIGADMVAGPGVELVLADPYKLPLEDGSIDVLLSGQMMEHCEFFWLSFQEMCRVVKPDGYIFVIAPSAGPIHRYPVDCYRFYPDAFRALAKYANCHLIDVWLDERGPWKDLVGVFRRTFPISARPNSSEDQASARQPFHIDDRRPAESPPEAEIKGGKVHYRKVLALVHEILEPRGYLEIGIRGGDSLRIAKCPAIGIDPKPSITSELDPQAKIVQSSSDNFFRTKMRPADFQVDLAFIDGMHGFEYVLRDFVNCEVWSSATTVIVIDDILPNHPLQASRVRKTRLWTGDVWKIMPCLRTYRPDLTLLPIDCKPTGLLIVAGLDSDNRTLWQNYNPIVKRYLHPRHAEVPKEVLARKSAVSPEDARLSGLLAVVKQAREREMTVEQLKARMVEWNELRLPRSHGCP